LIAFHRRRKMVHIHKDTRPKHWRSCELVDGHPNSCFFYVSCFQIFFFRSFIKSASAALSGRFPSARANDLQKRRNNALTLMDAQTHELVDVPLTPFFFFFFFLCRSSTRSASALPCGRCPSEHATGSHELVDMSLNSIVFCFFLLSYSCVVFFLFTDSARDQHRRYCLVAVH